MSRSSPPIGIILDGNGPSTVNIIAGTTTLSGNAPTARQLELNEENDIAAAAAAAAEAPRIRLRPMRSAPNKPISPTRWPADGGNGERVDR